MQLIRSFLNDIIRRPSLYLFGFILIFSIDRHHRYEAVEHPDNGPFYSDVFEYYSFLPEYFLDFRQVPEQNFSTSKRTIGMAIMYSPAFFVGHCIAKYTGDITDGYSPPYHWAVRWGSIIYCIIGLFFCRNSLLRFFSEPVTAVALAAVYFGTNLFNYTYASGEFPHSYLFFLNALFIFFTLRWVDDKRLYALPALFFIGGMITLIRPTGILVFLFPLLYRVSSWSDLKERLTAPFKKTPALLMALVLFLLPLFFQALIWKNYQGHFVHYSYKDERFFFNDPQVVNFLFSFRKGWLIYTPIMLFALIGMLMAARRLRVWFLFSWIYFALNVYVLSSWWDWAYGGSFGCRVLIESYAFFIFPLAVFVSWLWDLGNKKAVRYSLRAALLLVVYLLIELNFFQTWQFKYGRIHWSGMNYETYKAVFLRKVTTEEMNEIDKHFTPPDPEKMKRGERDH